MEKLFKLTDEEILSSLDKTSDGTVIGEVQKICFDILYKDVDRTDSIDSKASHLTGIGGLSLSLVFALGGIIIKEMQNVYLPYIGYSKVSLTFFYISTSLTLLLSIIFSILAISARSDWKWLKDTDIFNESVLTDAMMYKKYISNHVWQIYRNNYLINEKKASRLKRAQYIFLLALVQLFIIVLIIGVYVFVNGG